MSDTIGPRFYWRLLEEEDQKNRNTPGMRVNYPDWYSVMLQQF